MGRVSQTDKRRDSKREKKKDAANERDGVESGNR